ncbi:hypothetical protein PDE01_44830 [Paracoccus denitrificans]|nr:hypothetical protein PDE01_44830 [Paracoccus denitrificans]
MGTDDMGRLETMRKGQGSGPRKGRNKAKGGGRHHGGGFHVSLPRVAPTGNQRPPAMFWHI